ncbi:MAG: hypothetical protein Q8O62_01715 [Aequorivita sp.]|nr:hypothetical protein [Aequorivita sp.]
MSNINGLWKLESMKVRDTVTNTWNHYKGGMDGYCYMTKTAMLHFTFMKKDMKERE